MSVKALWLTGLWILASAAMPTRAQVHAPIDAPIDMEVPVAPTPVKSDGKIHLVYELHLTNFNSSELALVRIEVLGRDAIPLAQYEGTELNGLLDRPGLPPTNQDPDFGPISAREEKQHLSGGMRAIVYIWLTVDSPSAVPTVLRHRVTMNVHTPAGSGGSGGGDAAGKNEPIEMKSEGAEIKVHSEAPLVISRPLRGGEWLAANGPANRLGNGHRRSLVPVAGKAHIAQRFAIDWLQLREDGQTFTGDRLKNENYRCYGAEALAVADAVVVAVKDGIPENTPGATSRRADHARNGRGQPRDSRSRSGPVRFLRSSTTRQSAPQSGRQSPPRPGPCPRRELGELHGASSSFPYQSSRAGLTPSHEKLVYRLPQRIGDVGR
jgi:hypothetical protein